MLSREFPIGIVLYCVVLNTKDYKQSISSVTHLASLKMTLLLVAGALLSLVSPVHSVFNLLHAVRICVVFSVSATDYKGLIIT